MKSSRKTHRDFLENVDLNTEVSPNQETVGAEQHIPKLCNRHLSDTAVPAHVYFLIREQAKSLVAIKNLKERVHSVEGILDNVCQAVSGLQFQMDCSLHNTTKAKMYPSAKQEDGISAKASTNQIQSSRSGRIRPTVASGVEDTKKDHCESDSKQDSGLDSDCQAHASLSITKKRDGEGDELLDLLDVIAEKGSGLWKRVEECEKLKILEEEETREALSSQDAAGLLQACRSLQRRLGIAERERIALANRMVYLERVAQDAKSENVFLEEKLESVIRDKQKLESQIHRLHSQFVTSKNTSGKSEQSGGMEQKPKKMGRLRNNEESRNRVAAILKETNVLELQKQLLTYIVENEVLTAKLEQLDAMRLSAAAEIEKTEARMQSELQQLLKERNELQAAVEESRREMTTFQAKTKMLERVLHAVSQDPNHFASLEAPANSVRSQPSPNGSRQTHSRLQLLSSSLPPVLFPGCEHYVQEITPFGDTSGYLNITGEEGQLDRTIRNSPVLNANNDRRGYRWSSTPIRSRFETPGFGSFSKLSVPHESQASSNVGKELKSSRAQAFLDEFDPLCATPRDKHGGGKANDFVDSLDLTPTKVTKAFELPVSESPKTLKMPMAHMGNISFPRTPLIRQAQRDLRYPQSAKRLSEPIVQSFREVDEALL